MKRTRKSKKRNKNNKNIGDRLKERERERGGESEKRERKKMLKKTLTIRKINIHLSITAVRLFDLCVRRNKIKTKELKKQKKK